MNTEERDCLTHRWRILAVMVEVAVEIAALLEI